MIEFEARLFPLRTMSKEAFITRTDFGKIAILFYLAHTGSRWINHCAKFWHALWVAILFAWDFLFNLFIANFLSSKVNFRMGGTRKRVEPPNCEHLKKNQDIWKLLEKGGMVPYIERLQEVNKDVIGYFEKHWRDGTIILHGRKVTMDEKLIADVTSLSTDDMKYYRDKNYIDTAL